MSNRKTKPVDPNINLFTIAAQLSTTANNINNESSTTSEEENNPRQLKVPRLAKESLNWNLNWPKIYPWVYHGEEAGKNNNFTKGRRYFKKQSLDRHVTTSNHEMVCAIRMQSQATLYSSFTIQARNDQIKIMKNMRNIYFLIQHNLSTNIFESLCKLSELQRIKNQDQFECSNEILNIIDNDFSIDNERVLYGSYQNNVTSREFIESIGHIIEQEVFQELHSTANTITAEIDRFVLAKNISYNKLMHICTDGASTMRGVHNGISTQLKNKNLFILEHHCILHKLALAAKDAAKQVEDVEHMIHLKMIEENTSDPQLTVLNIIETHSDENKVAKALYNSIDQIDNKINTIELPAIIAKFANTTITLLEKRFPNRIQIDAFHIFDPIALLINNTDLQNYSEDEIEILNNFYGQDKYVSGNLFSAKLNSENLKHEWLLVRYLLTNYKNLNFLEIWQRIFLDLPTFKEIYPETT
ncbi:4847_t:CDS:2, partial [Scutellospora calospora]